MLENSGIKSQALIRQATCIIQVDGKSLGTAFLISEDGYLLTAGHVVKDSPKNISVLFLNDEPLEVSIIDGGKPNKKIGIDYAVLKINKFYSSLKPLIVKSVPEPRGSFVCYGYNADFKDPSDADGSFTGLHHCRSTAELYLLKLKSEQLGKGYSGAPIYCCDNDAVVGLQCEKPIREVGPDVTTRFAMPIARIAILSPIVRRIAKKNEKKLPKSNPQIRSFNDYKWDIYFSYPRKSDLYTDWIRETFIRVFKKYLEMHCQLFGKNKIKYTDVDLLPGYNWSDQIEEGINHSRCILSFWGCDYFRIPRHWAEIDSFRKRDKKLIIPIILHDGKHFPPETNGLHPVNFSEYTEVNDRKDPDYTAFTKKVRELSERVSEIIGHDHPQWQSDFPITKWSSVNQKVEKYIQSLWPRYETTIEVG